MKRQLAFITILLTVLITINCSGTEDKKADTKGEKSSTSQKSKKPVTPAIKPAPPSKPATDKFMVKTPADTT